MALNTSDPAVQKALLVILLAGGALYGYFTYVFQPRQEEIALLKADVRRVEENLSTARAIAQAADTASLNAEILKRGRELELAEALLPREENLAQLLRRVAVEADRQGLGFPLFEPRPPVQHELFQERPYQVTLRGGYHRMAMFLTAVADLPQIIKPGAVRMSRDTRAGSEEGETVVADMALTTYLMIQAPPATATGDRQ